MGFPSHCTPRARRAGVAPPRRRCRYDSSARLVPTRAGRTLLTEKPTRARYTLWILDATLFRDRPEYAHRYRLRDDQGRPLVDHGTIRVFELSKFDVEPVQNDAERWLRFLKDGETLDPTRLPAWMQPPIMRSAMNTLNAFSEKERDYHRYQSRQEALRVQRAVAYEFEERRAAEQVALKAAEAERQAKDAERHAKEAALRDKEAERQAKEAALQDKEAALAEIARLKALLDRQTKR